MIFFNEGLKVYKSDKIPNKEFVHGFGTRETGELKDMIEYDTLIVPEQVHAANSAVVDVSDDHSSVLEIAAVDGVITRKPRIALTVRTADCVPIVFVDKKKKIVGISHQGWKGTLQKLPEKMIAQFSNLKSPRFAKASQGEQISNIVVVIGPSIGACCYNIDEDRTEKFANEFPTHKDRVFETHGGRIHLNLAYLCYLMIRDCGVPAENIDFFPFCTSCDKQKFYSFRREGSARKADNMSFVMMR